MVIIWVYRTTRKKRKKVIASNPDAEYKLLKENHKKDQLINLLEKKLYGY
ncbi:MAG: hypothetical protein ACFFAU_21125 [Candidatus Hodarchaeota archaeon]